MRDVKADAQANTLCRFQACSAAQGSLSSSWRSAHHRCSRRFTCSPLKRAPQCRLSQKILSDLFRESLAVGIFGIWCRCDTQGHPASRPLACRPAEQRQPAMAAVQGCALSGRLPACTGDTVLCTRELMSPDLCTSIQQRTAQPCPGHCCYGALAVSASRIPEGCLHDGLRQQADCTPSDACMPLPGGVQSLL